MPKNDKEMLENLKARIKKQNEKAKENWDTVSCRLPKGTKERIKALGLTINGVINESVLAYLDCMEEAQAEEEQNAADSAEIQERKEREEQERRKLLANPEYAATYAQLMAMETAEKEKKRAEMLTRARLETL